MPGTAPQLHLKPKDEDGALVEVLAAWKQVKGHFYGPTNWYSCWHLHHDFHRQPQRT